MRSCRPAGPFAATASARLLRPRTWKTAAARAKPPVGTFPERRVKHAPAAAAPHRAGVTALASPWLALLALPLLVRRDLGRHDPGAHPWTLRTPPLPARSTRDNEVTTKAAAVTVAGDTRRDIRIRARTSRRIQPPQRVTTLSPATHPAFGPALRGRGVPCPQCPASSSLVYDGQCHGMQTTRWPPCDINTGHTRSD